ncbi:hypothetical protein H0H92_012090 [Tricholoma furcatifolium]|nr:hypothetical protein H0H92_012090 [Tricholoma furcatifolium]
MSDNLSVEDLTPFLKPLPSQVLEKCPVCSGSMGPLTCCKGLGLSSNWGWWFQMCWNSACSGRFLWHTKESLPADSIPVVGTAGRLQAKSLICANTPCTGRANRSCSQPLGAFCSKCCKGTPMTHPCGAQGAHRPDHLAEDVALELSQPSLIPSTMWPTSNVPSSSQPSLTPTTIWTFPNIPSSSQPSQAQHHHGPGRLYARPLDPEYGKAYAHALQNRVEAGRIAKENAATQKSLAQTVEVVIWIQSGHPSRFKIVTAQLGVLDLTKDGQDIILPFIRPLQGVFSVLQDFTRSAWAVQSISTPIQFTRGKVLIRHIDLPDRLCISLYEEVASIFEVYNGPHCGDITTVRSPVPFMLQATPRVTPPIKNEPLILASLPFPLFKDMDKRLRHFGALRTTDTQKKHPNKLRLSLFDEHFPFCRYVASTFRRDLLVYHRGEDLNLVEAYRNKPDATWLAFSKAVNGAMASGASLTVDLVKRKSNLDSSDLDSDGDPPFKKTRSTSSTQDSLDVIDISEDSDDDIITQVYIVSVTTWKLDEETGDLVDAGHRDLSGLELLTHLEVYRAGSKKDIWLGFCSKALPGDGACVLKRINNDRVYNNPQLHKAKDPYDLWFESARLRLVGWALASFIAACERVKADIAKVDVVPVHHVYCERHEWMMQPRLTGHNFNQGNHFRGLLRETLTAFSHYSSTVKYVHMDFQGFLVSSGVFTIYDCTTHVHSNREEDQARLFSGEEDTDDPGLPTAAGDLKVFIIGWRRMSATTSVMHWD